MALEADALKLIQSTAVDAASVKVITIPDDGDNVLVAVGGSYKERPLPAVHRNHKAFDVDSLLAVVDKSSGYGEDGEKNAAVWHSEEAIVAVLDDETRRDFVALKLEYSKAFAAVRALSAGKSHSQAEFVRLLKVDLDGCVPADLLAAVRTLKFVRNEEGKSDLQHGASSLGRAVEAKITGATAIPESFLVNTNVYSNVLKDATVSLRVAIDIDMEEHAFTLSVIGDDLSDAVLQTQDLLSDLLKEGDDKRRVLFGKP